MTLTVPPSYALYLARYRRPLSWDPVHCEAALDHHVLLLELLTVHVMVGVDGVSFRSDEAESGGRVELGSRDVAGKVSPGLGR